MAGVINFALSPMHIDTYSVEQTALLSACHDIETLLVDDTPGWLKPKHFGPLTVAAKADSRGEFMEIRSQMSRGSPRSPN